MWKHHLGWGLGLGLTVVATIQVLTWMGLGLSNWTWILPWAWMALFAFLAGKSLQRRQGARPTIAQALGLLLVLFLVARLAYQTYMFLYLHHVDPTWVDSVAEVWSAQLAEAGSTPTEIDEQIAFFRRQWETDFVFTVGLVAYSLPELGIGLLSLLAGVVQPWKKRTA